jgi:hypothetical protein
MNQWPTPCEFRRSRGPVGLNGELWCDTGSDRVASLAKAMQARWRETAFANTPASRSDAISALLSWAWTDRCNTRIVGAAPASAQVSKAHHVALGQTRRHQETP